MIFETICSLSNVTLNQLDSYFTGGGLFTLFVSMIGLVATSRRSPCLLRFYAFMLLVAFLVLLGGITCSVKVYLFDYNMAYQYVPKNFWRVWYHHICTYIILQVIFKITSHKDFRSDDMEDLIINFAKKYDPKSKIKRNIVDQFKQLEAGVWIEYIDILSW